MPAGGGNNKQGHRSGGKAGGSVRIIGGEWRSRRLPVADVPGLRPSTDRVRETLFNWLQRHLRGAACADLFAGTGALGFEAASRGAARVTLVEKDPGVAGQLEASVRLLGARRVTVHRGDALRWLEGQAPASLDIVFVDPPFADDLHHAALAKLAESGCMQAGGLVYVESPAPGPAPVPPAGWSVHREKVIGDVRMQVFAVE